MFTLDILKLAHHMMSKTTKAHFTGPDNSVTVTELVTFGNESIGEDPKEVTYEEFGSCTHPLYRCGDGYKEDYRIDSLLSEKLLWASNGLRPYFPPILK
jgi:hypothetical protein